ncbi:unnamed protein product (macronuclear) [Paramecium tetraurelia]|uniref:Uncharacterized protein n=1 Tax=Paramecium tetraurelia TaxID=5888 RepID=A0DTA7_PARTE|nr:uncharacterized protein GSPATT00019967001 [Paramecium tetraurelia]CAK86274.1 unnamed protein product [Paramecium tetraurelia]|eukprot:XP_001453671.1 hypothetical protein (macronuclear) [Paramecium tetraurelia strain d4-2]
MAILLTLTILSIAFSQKKTAICDIEQYFEFEQNENILDHTKINQTDIMLTNSNIYLLDENLMVLNSIRTPDIQDYECNRVTTHPLHLIFLLACQSQQQGVNPILFAYKANGLNNYEQFGDAIYLPSIKEKFEKMTIVGNSLLIPLSDKILTFTTVISNTTWYLKTTSYTIDAQFLNVSTLNITGFDIYSYAKDFQTNFRILISDFESGVYWIEAILKSNNIVPYNSGKFNLKNFYILNTARFRSVVILNATDSSTLFVLQTYVDGSFMFENLFTNGQIYFYSTLNKYKDWNPISSIRNNQNAILIPYQNYQKVVVINLFNIRSLKENELMVEPNDLLISASIDDLILYFISENRLVFRSDVDALTRCTLMNYQEE